MTVEIGRSPDGSGSRPSDGAASVSTVPASIPNAVDRSAILEMVKYEIARSGVWESFMIRSGLLRDILVAHEWMRQTIEHFVEVHQGSTQGHAAIEALDSLRAFAASGIEARSDETRSGSAEGESPVPAQQGDAQ